MFLEASKGTYILVRYEVSPIHVIRDLVFLDTSDWLKSNTSLIAVTWTFKIWEYHTPGYTKIYHLIQLSGWTGTGLDEINECIAIWIELKYILLLVIIRKFQSNLLNLLYL